MPIFIPPIIAGHNTTQVTNDMYLIKTGMRKQDDKLQFWTLQKPQLHAGFEICKGSI